MIASKSLASASPVISKISAWGLDTYLQNLWCVLFQVIPGMFAVDESRVYWLTKLSKIVLKLPLKWVVDRRAGKKVEDKNFGSIDFRGEIRFWSRSAL